MRGLFVIGLLFFGIVSFSHPLHLSVTSLEFKEDSLFLSIRVFRDDFFASLNPADGPQIMNNDSINQKAVQYLLHHLKIDIEGKHVDIPFWYLKTDNLSVTYHFKGIFRFEKGKISFENRILTEYFNDQKNLVIVKTQHIEKGLEFDVIKQKTEIEID